ncbi:MAG: amidohydrolase family protein [Candidatus Hydrogenedentes bacterium]|nr:amidohydrolase family protein [Candidatus Hydrogenedentota bacterium]
MPTHENPLVVRGIIVGDERPSDVVLQGGRVVSVRPAGRVRPALGSKTARIGPTLFDIQVNGANGINLQGGGVTVEDVGRLTAFLEGWGVSRWAPTICTNTPEAMEHGCRILAEALRERALSRAIPGIHVEGPYLSPMDGPRGAHSKRYVRTPSLRELDGLLKAADGRILYITVAPELDGIVPFIKGAIRRGVKVALGHHHAGADDIARAVDAGARLCTHLGNGLASEINRHRNPLWPQLVCDELYGSFIADLHHLPEPVLQAFVRVKRPERTILTSDSVRLAGLKPGRYPHHSGIEGMAVELLPSGKICLLGTDLLSGSSLMLLQGVANAARVTDLTLEQAFASASRVPAEALGLRPRPARPVPGKKADFVLFDLDEANQWKATVRAVFVDGRRVGGDHG